VEQESGTRDRKAGEVEQDRELSAPQNAPKWNEDNGLVPPLVPLKTIGISTFGTSGTKGTKKIRNSNNRVIEGYIAIYLFCFRDYIESLFHLFPLFHL
jgi:hypothetical protein